MRVPCPRAYTGSVLLLLLAPALAAALEPGVPFFEQKVRPVLVPHCYSCHSATAKKVRGGLRVDSRAALLKGGDTGPAIVPGKPQASLLIQALHQDGLAMPPKGPLPEEVIADFERWVQMGAPDPRDDQPLVSRPTITLPFQYFHKSSSSAPLPSRE